MSDIAVNKELAQAENEKKLEAYKTNVKKAQYINEVKFVLGPEIKKNPKPKIIKQSKFKLFLTKLKNMF